MRDDAGIGLLVGYTMLIFLRGFAGDAAIFAHPAVLAERIAGFRIDAAGDDVGFRLTADGCLWMRAMGFGMSVYGHNHVCARHAADPFNLCIRITGLAGAAPCDGDAFFGQNAADRVL